MRIKIKMRAKIMIMVKEPVVRQEGEGARGLNVHREVVGARPFIAQIEIPKSNLVGTEAQVEKSILTNKHLDLKRSSYMSSDRQTILRSSVTSKSKPELFRLSSSRRLTVIEEDEST